MSVAGLAKSLGSRDADSRLRTLFRIREQIDWKLLKGYFPLAKRLIGDPDNDCRWQALIIVGEFTRTHPEDVLKVILHHGNSDDGDMRMGVACVLLEHLLGHHFHDYFPRVRQEAIRSPLFAHTLSLCGNFVPSKRDWNKVRSLVRELDLVHVPADPRREKR